MALQGYNLINNIVSVYFHLIKNYRHNVIIDELGKIFGNESLLRYFPASDVNIVQSLGKLQ
jgi:hypothetical protein